MRLANILNFKLNKDYSYNFFFIAPNIVSLTIKLGLASLLYKKFPQLFTRAFVVEFKNKN